MRKTLSSILLAVTCALSATAQGTLNFANSASSLIMIDGTTPATSAHSIRVEIVWAPLGTTDESLFQSVPGFSVSVGVPIAGRFSGGTRTIPAGTGFDGIAPGAVVSCIVRGWSLFYGPTYDQSSFRNRSAIFTVDTGDPTLSPAESPGTLVNFQGLVFIPEPGVAGIMIAGLMVFTSRKRIRT